MLVIFQRLTMFLVLCFASQLTLYRNGTMTCVSFDNANIDCTYYLSRYDTRVGLDAIRRCTELLPRSSRSIHLPPLK